LRQNPKTIETIKEEVMRQGGGTAIVQPGNRAPRSHQKPQKRKNRPRERIVPSRGPD